MNFKDEAKKLNLDIEDNTLNDFEKYYAFLIEYNKHTNLTRIVEHDEVFIKHFLDSLLLIKSYDFSNKKICDVGAGAGFPSVPCAIIDKSIKVDIVDSLNKRITFLNELFVKLAIKNVKAIHNRAEDVAKTSRESYDIVSARAVARLNILAELCLPLVKIGGVFLAMKSKDYELELNEAKGAIGFLGGEIIGIKHYDLPLDMGQREVIIIKKIKKTPKGYPRIFSKIKNKPLS